MLCFQQVAYGGPSPNPRTGHRPQVKAGHRLHNNTFRACSCRAQQDSETLASLPPELTHARNVKKAGLVLSGGLVAAGAAYMLSSDTELSAGIVQIATKALAAFAFVLGIAKVILQDKLAIELYDGGLVIEIVPSLKGPGLQEGAVEVRATGDLRGRGAFAAKDIPAGTFLGWYQGNLLSEQQYWHRYPSGTSDFCIGIDRQWTIDGREAAKSSSFRLSHINHSSSRSNLQRRTMRRERKVAFVTSQPLQEGQELLIDYGRTFWLGREHQELT
ncbi:hypothetical protein WJX74_001697 [Apatococcus lobatus]|uniref:SET domain-containing protein n=1 Tax=Apatococcus lobatus TaxID=904363 RepID=A0AAW1S3J3_9CHLO